MKLKALHIFLALSIFQIAFSGTACTSYRAGRSSDVIPQGWKKVDSDLFSFALPPAMRGGEEPGTDSGVWKYQGEGIVLVIEMGQHPTDLVMDRHEPGYRDGSVDIDGRKAKIATFQLSASRAAYFANEGKYVAAVHFPDIGNSFATRMTLWANCDDLATQEIAKQIFLTVKFK